MHTLTMFCYNPFVDRLRRIAGPYWGWLVPSAIGILSLLLMVFHGALEGETPGFPLDDAWIHMVYGRCLALHGMLCYNPGTPSTGSTSPLWALLVAIIHLLVGPHNPSLVVTGIKLLGGILHLLTGIVVYYLLKVLTERPLPAMLGALLYEISPPLVEGALSGMEVALTAFLLTLGVLYVLTERPSLGGVVLALAALARPESGLSILIIALFFLKRPRNLLRFLLPSLVLGGLLLARNYFVSGLPFPATYYMKKSLSLKELPWRIWIGTTGLATQVPPFTWGVGWLLLLPLLLFRNRKVWIVLGAGLAYFIGNLIIIAPKDPKAFYHLRYVLPSIAPLIVGSVAGSVLLGKKLSERLRSLPYLFLFGFSLIASLLTFPAWAEHFHSDVRSINEVQVAMGKWIHEHLPGDGWIATVDAGAVRYFSGHPAVDIMGLNTPQLYFNSRAFIPKHPIQLVALLPAWVRPAHRDSLKLLRRFTAKNYRVTSFPQMATQGIYQCTKRIVYLKVFVRRKIVPLVCSEPKIRF